MTLKPTTPLGGALAFTLLTLTCLLCRPGPAAGTVEGLANPASPSHYIIVPLRPPDRTRRTAFTHAYALNESTQIAGVLGEHVWSTLFGGRWSPFTDGFPAVLDAHRMPEPAISLDRYGVEALGLNDQGVAVGRYRFDTSLAPPVNPWRAFLWPTQGSAIELPKLPGFDSAVARDINNLGVVVGASGERACVWRDGQVSELPGVPGQIGSEARTLNNAGLIVGSVKGAGRLQQAATWTNEAAALLPALPGGSVSGALAVNEAGDIAGYSDTGQRDADGGPLFHAVLWRNGQAQDLGTLPGAGESQATGLNDRGQVVGNSGGRPFLWQDGRMWDLTELLSGQLFDLKQAVDINDQGMIAGNGLDLTFPDTPQGYWTKDRGCLLIPTTFYRADVSVEVGAAPERPVAGQNLTYTLTVSNLGPATAAGVTLVQALPSGAAFVGADSSQGGVTQAEGTVTASLGNLADNGSATVRVTLRPDAPGALATMARVSTFMTDPNPENNRAAATLTVHPPTADLVLRASGASAPVAVGTEVTYSLAALNQGPEAAEDVRLALALPAGVAFVSARSNRGVCSFSGDTLTCALEALGLGDTLEVSVVVRPTAAGAFNSTPRVTSRVFDPTPENNTATLTTTVQEPAAAPDLTGAWRGLSQARRGSGRRAVYTLRGAFVVRNTGQGEAPASQVHFFLSRDQRLDARDSLLRRADVRPLDAGASSPVNWAVSLRRGVSARGLYVLAVLDRGNAVPESDEGNNTVPAGPVR